MSDTVTDWLPKAAFSDEVIKAALSGPLGGWSVRWFSEHRAEISGVQLLSEAPSTADEKGTRFCAGLVSVELTEHAKRYLLNALLSVETLNYDIGDCDRAVLAALVVEVIEDLVTRLNGDLRGEVGTGSGTLAFDVAFGKTVVATIALPAHAIVSLIKAGLGEPRRMPALPQDRSVALGQVRLTAEALLGNAELGAQDLKGLAAGDVLVLNRALDEPVALRLSGGGGIFARGKLGRNGQHVAVQL